MCASTAPTSVTSSSSNFLATEPQCLRDLRRLTVYCLLLLLDLCRDRLHALDDRGTALQCYGADADLFHSPDRKDVDCKSDVEEYTTDIFSSQVADNEERPIVSDVPKEKVIIIECDSLCTFVVFRQIREANIFICESIDRKFGGGDLIIS
ncbi:hypothetical protein ACLOJK_023104, partial [Asimina triloba]